MNSQEAVVLTRLVAAACPQQAIDEYTPDAWFDLLGDLDFADCRAAVVTVGKSQAFIAPAEIRAEVRRIRNDRVAHALIPAPDPGLVNNPRAYKAALAESVRRAADGDLPPAPVVPAIRMPQQERRNGQPAALSRVLTETRAVLAACRRQQGEPAGGDPE